MSERDRKIAMSVAAGAAVAGAAAMIGFKSAKGKSTPAPEREYPDEETSGRGKPAAGPDRESREVGYDVKDASVSALVKVIAFSLTIMVVSVAAVFFMFSRFDHAYQEPNADLTAEQRAPILPPLPPPAGRALPRYRRGADAADAAAHDLRVGRLRPQGCAYPDRARDAAGDRQSRWTARRKPTPPGRKRPTRRNPPVQPAFNADLQQDKPADRIQGEGQRQRGRAVRRRAVPSRRRKP